MSDQRLAEFSLLPAGCGVFVPRWSDQHTAGALTMR